MPGYEPQVIDDVRRAVDIVDVVGETVALRRRGRKLWGLCPFHGEKTPSFTVDPDQQLFYCFGCHKGGNVFTYVMERDRRSFPEAVESLAERAGMAVSPAAAPQAGRRERLRALLAAAQEYFRQGLESNGAATAELARRGVDGDLARRFGIGYAPDSWDGLVGALGRRGFKPDEMVEAGVAASRPRGGVYDRMRGRITFPIPDADGRLVGFGGRIVGEGEPKYLNSPDTPLYQKGRILYRTDLSRLHWRDKPPILVEGYFDVLACHRAGLPEAVASLGTALTMDHVRYLRRFTDRAILCYDSDRAGVEAAERAFQMLAESGVAVLHMAIPSGKDVDEFLALAGAERVREEAARAMPYLTRRIQERAGDVRRDPASKAEAVRELKPLLLAVQDPVERQGHLQLLERTWALDPRILAQALRTKQGPEGNKPGNFRHNMGRQPEKFALPKDEVNLLGWLIQFPDQMEGVLTTLPELCKDARWSDIAAAWPVLQQMPLADWIGTLPVGARELAAEAAMAEVPASREAVNGLALALRRRRQEERWQELKRRAAAGPLDPDLEREIMALWPEIREAKQSPRKEG
jgi:DNA primase